MARLHTDLLNTVTPLWNELPFIYKVSLGLSLTSFAASLGCSVVTIGNAMTKKVMRWGIKDQTTYVAWNDLQGQINRLANDRFDNLRGALAPAAIYDSKAFFNAPTFEKIMKGGHATKNKAVIFIGGAALLGISARALMECQSISDPHATNTQNHCWDLLGQHILDPISLSLLALGYTASSASSIGLPILLIIPSGIVIKSFSVGLASKKFPTCMRKTSLVLTERYQDLAKHLTTQWNKAKNSNNSVEKEHLIDLAKKIKRKSTLLPLAMEEFFALDSKDSIKIVTPLLEAVNYLILDAATPEKNKE